MNILQLHLAIFRLSATLTISTYRINEVKWYHIVRVQYYRSLRSFPVVLELSLFWNLVIFNMGIPLTFLRSNKEALEKIKSPFRY